MNKSDKWEGLIITGTIVLIAFFLLPLASFRDKSVDGMDIIENDKSRIVALLVLLGSVSTIAAGFKQNRLMAISGSICNTGCMLLLWYSLDTATEKYAEKVYQYYGYELENIGDIGFYLALVASIVSVIFAAKVKKE